MIVWQADLKAAVTSVLIRPLRAESNRQEGHCCEDQPLPDVVGHQVHFTHRRTR